MDNSVLASLAVYKQQRRRRLIKKKHKRRHLLNIRRILLDTTYPNLFIRSFHNEDIPVDDNLKLTSSSAFITEEQNEHSSDGTLDLCANEESRDDQDLNHHNGNVKCNLKEEKFHADIYDIDVDIIFYQLIDRLWPEIIEYKQQLASNSSNEYNDIPLNALYRNMISRLAYGVDFVSLILHVDGVSLCKSSKLTIWLLSGIFIELPTHLQYRRH
ncbi:unnamed protein product, partial [Rotaria sp. Silwood1]